MEEKQVDKICKRLDTIIALLSCRTVEDKDDKVYAFKKAGMGSKEIGALVGIKNVRCMEGWKRK